MVDLTKNIFVALAYLLIKLVIIVGFVNLTKNFNFFVALLNLWEDTSYLYLEEDH